jgi:hypothetical protein
MEKILKVNDLEPLMKQNSGVILKLKNLELLMKQNSGVILKLKNLGILKTTEENCQSYHIGKSDYSNHIIQPWHVWLEYNLNPWDADIVKRVLRNKKGDSRDLDYKKIIHDCKERLRQLAEEREADEFKD